MTTIRRAATRAALAACLAMAVATASPAPAAAQETIKIVAVVNDEAISAYDLDQRLNLIIRTSNLPDTAHTRTELGGRVLRSLVDEKLQFQEATRLNVSVSQSELDSALALIERQNKLPRGGLDGFLESRGVDKQTVVSQVRAGLAWRTVVQRRLGQQIHVSDSEIADAMARIKANADKPRHLVAEIFLAVDSPNDEAEVRRNAMKIMADLRNGASFPLLSRQFSQSPSAQRGGDLGWVQPGELDPEVEKVLSTMPIGNLAGPIHTTAGFSIVLLRDRRDPGGQSAPTTLTLRQVVLEKGKPGAEDPAKLAATVRETVRGCDDFAALGVKMGNGPWSNLGKVRTTDLPADLRKVLASLDVGMPSEPIPAENGLRMLMICERDAPAAKPASLPSEEDVRRRLFNEKIEARARRYLRDLRQAAFLEIRA